MTEVFDRLKTSMDHREQLTERLIVALSHLDRDKAIAIVSSFFSLKELKEIVEFQEREN